MFVVVTLLVILVSLCASWLWNRRERQLTFLRQGVPGPKPNIFLGNLALFKEDTILQDFLMSATKTYGRRFSFSFAYRPAIFTTDLNDMQEVLIKNFDNFRNRAGLISVSNLTTRAVVALRDQDWKRVRSTLSPSFSAAKLKSFMARVMKKRTTFLMEEIEKQRATGKPINFLSLFRCLTLDVIAESAFATNINSVQNYDEALPFINALGSVIPSRFNKTTKALEAFLPESVGQYFKSKEDKEHAEEHQRIKRYIRKVVNDRKSEVTREQDVLQLMIDSRENKHKTPLSSDEILGNVEAFLVAGYDTTATALSFTSLLLASHPEIQDRLYEEIKDNITDLDAASFDDVKRLNYLDQVWHESLRLYPPAGGMLGREVSNTTTLGDVKLPAGIFVMMSPLMVHHDPEYWPEPQKFDPERWAPENRDSIHPCSFIAFGEGPRHCIGKRFAEIEAKFALMKLINTYELRPENKENTHPMPLGKIIPTISPATGSILLKATPRKSA